MVHDSTDGDLSKEALSPSRARARRPTHRLTARSGERGRLSSGKVLPTHRDRVNAGSRANSATHGAMRRVGPRGRDGRRAHLVRRAPPLRKLRMRSRVRRSNRWSDRIYDEHSLRRRGRRRRFRVATSAQWCEASTPWRGRASPSGDVSYSRSMNAVYLPLPSLPIGK